MASPRSPVCREFVTAEPAPVLDPVVTVVMRLLAPPAMTDDRIAQTEGTPAKDRFRTSCPVEARLAMVRREWDKGDRTALEGSLTQQNLARMCAQKRAFLLPLDLAAMLFGNVDRNHVARCGEPPHRIHTDNVAFAACQVEVRIDRFRIEFQCFSYCAHGFRSHLFGRNADKNRAQIEIRVCQPEVSWCKPRVSVYGLIEITFDSYTFVQLSKRRQTGEIVFRGARFSY
jgi:hypothetical protein